MSNIDQLAQNPYPSVSPGVDKIRRRWVSIDSMAGVGIDPDVSKIPAEIWMEAGEHASVSDVMTLFNKRIIDATAEHTVDYKVNSNFFQGEAGRRALAETFAYLKTTQPDVVRICDGKFADVGHTADKISDEIFGELDADGVLLNPYMGVDAIQPFTKWANKIIVLCINTSNPSAAEIQDLPLANGQPLWKYILEKSMNEWNEHGNILPVLSATHPKNLDGIRDIVGDTPILLAGIGTQGGDLATSVTKTLDSQGYGLMISASRAILYPDRLPGESLQDASARSVVTLKDAINDAKQVDS